MARQLGISRGTVAGALGSDRPPVYRRALKGSAVDAVEPVVRELLRQTPTMPVTVTGVPGRGADRGGSAAPRPGVGQPVTWTTEVRPAGTVTVA